MFLITFLAGITEKVNRHFSDRIVAQRLEYLDDRLLRDIGLAREAGRIVAYNFSDEELATGEGLFVVDDDLEDSGG